jgi:multicomponent K+:H+ antiporter subunit G
MSDIPDSPENIVAAVFVLLGAFFVLVGAVGLYRLPDIFMRLHAPTKATTLGLGGVLVGSVVYFSFHSEAGFSFHEILISVFLFITAPVSGHLIAKAAIRKNVAHCSAGESMPEESGEEPKG